MSDLRDLYQEVILDHGRSPRNFRAVEGANRSAEGFNPLCGDQVTVSVRYRDGVLEDVGFQGKGCAISTASASMLTEILRGKTREEVEKVARAFHDMITGQPGQEIATDVLGKLAVFSGVCEFPNRVKCASLVWHTLEAALDQSAESVTTEE